MRTKAVDRERLLFRIRRTIQNLERTPVEDRRGIYGNLIKFAELHPTKVRLGLYAPVATPEMKKAGNENSLPAENLSSIEEPEGLRDCSRTVSFGA